MFIYTIHDVLGAILLGAALFVFLLYGLLCGFEKLGKWWRG